MSMSILLVDYNFVGTLENI